MLLGNFDRSRSITSTYFSLMPTTPRGPDQSHGDGGSFDDVIDVIAEHLFVFMQQRLALGGIDQNRIGLCGEFDVGGKPGPAGPHNSRLETSSTLISAMRSSKTNANLLVYHLFLFSWQAQCFRVCEGRQGVSAFRGRLSGPGIEAIFV